MWHRPSSRPSPPGEGETFPVAWKQQAAGLVGRVVQFAEMCQLKTLSKGRVALLGIAQRQIHVKFSSKRNQSKHSKPLQSSVKTLGCWIRAKRIEKNFTPGQLGARMGIAQAVVRAWEEGAKEPDGLQLAFLEKIFGCHWG